MGDSKRFFATLATTLVFGFIGIATSAAEKGILWQLKCGPEFTSQPIYTRTAVLQHLTGVVLVEFSVNAKGRAERPVVLQAAAPELLQSAALQVVKSFECKPGRDWAKTGGPERRLRANVLFKFRGEEAPKLIDESAEVVPITAEVGEGFR